jgi:hypothetical protein
MAWEMAANAKQHEWDSSVNLAAPIQFWALVIDYFIVAIESIGDPAEPV